jgi:TorA maturation chaperone TorD
MSDGAVATETREGVELAVTWRLLALGFSAPTGETLAEVEALAEGLAAASPSSELDDVLEAVCGLAPARASAQYSMLFRGRVLVAPYEGSYELDPLRQGRQMADVAGFYKAFGAEAQGPAAERPDFVGCELEFLSFLDLRRVAAVESGEGDVEVIDGVREAFLTDHAGRWLPTFFARVAEEAPPGSLYAAVAALGARTVADELGRLGIAPDPLPGVRRHASLEGDAIECGYGP